jgi:hypothetical protein
METLKRRSIRVGLLAAPLLFLGAMADGHGGDGTLIHACVQKHDGDVRIVGAREHCRRNERALHWVREVPAPAPAPGPAPAPTAAVAELVDADNQVMGPVIAVAGNFPVVGIRREGRLYAFVTFTTPALFGLNMEPVYFTGPACDGLAYLVRSESPLPATGVDQAGNGYGDDGTGLQTVTVLSVGSMTGCDSVQDPGPADLAPALQVFAGNTFSQPFRVR